MLEVNRGPFPMQNSKQMNDIKSSSLYGYLLNDVTNPPTQNQSVNSWNN